MNRRWPQMAADKIKISIEPQMHADTRG